MADLRGTQLKNGFQTLVTIGSISETEPTNGALTNGKDQGITQVTLGLGSASAPSYSFTGDTNTGLFASGADAIGLVTGGTSRLAIDSSGNINIGGTTTIAKNVSGTFEGLVLNNSRGTQDEVGHVSKLSFQHNSVNASEIRSVNTEDFTTSAKQSADLTFHTILDGTLSEKVRINDDGKVGIGTDSPSFPFHVLHATTDTIAQFESGDASVAINLVASDNSLTVSTSSTDGLLKNNGAGNLRFFNNGSERMRIDSSGNVGIGTQTSSHPLTVRGASTLDTVVTYAKFEGGPTSQPSLSIGGNNTTTVGDRYAWIQAEQSDGTPTTHLVLNKDGGNVGIGTDSPGTTLDVTGGGTGNLIHVGDGTSSSQFMSFRGNGQSGAYIGWDGAGMLLQPGAGKEFKIKTGNVTFTNGSLAFLIDTSGNVGIGTTSPGAKLQVEGDLDVRTASNKNLHIRSFPSFDNFSNQGVGLSMSRTSSDADLMAVGVVDTDKLGLFSRSGIIFATGGNNAFQHTSEVVRIDGSGNVGIGTTSNSTFALEVQANSTSGVLAVQNAANDRNTFRSSNSGGTRTFDIGNNSNGHGIVNIRNSSGTVKAQLVGSGDSYFDAGNVGIGTGSTVDDKLHIVGTSIKIQEKGQTGTTIKFNHGNNASTNSDINIANIKSFVTDGSTGSEGGGLAFETKPTSGSATEVMRMDTASRMLVGKTSSGLGVEGVEFNTASHFTNFTRQRESVGGTIMQVNRTGTEADGSLMSFMREGSEKGSITVTGSATSFNTSSDYRLKENIKPLSSALETISKIKPSTFNFIDTPNETVDGFIAHELAEIVSYAVSGEKDGIDEDGNPIYQGVDHSKLVPLLVGAIQELKSEIEQLKNK